MKKEIGIIITKKEMEDLEKFPSISVCARKGCPDSMWCCGCSEQIGWEKEAKKYKKVPEIWEYMHNLYVKKEITKKIHKLQAELESVNASIDKTYRSFKIVDDYEDCENEN